MTHSSADSRIAAAEFRALMSRFPSGVTIVSTRDADGRPHGMTVSAFASLSMEPPLILVCIDAAATMSALLAQTTHFAVSILAQTQQELSRRFADTAMELRFEGVPTRSGAGGVPLVEGAHAVIECRRVAIHAAGDHHILVGDVIGGALGDDTEPLLYHRGSYGRLER